jgi:multicomponent Na+:H+ antiporter subunit B
MKRIEPSRALFALLLTALFAFVVVRAFTDSRSGLTMNSATLSQRVSYAYLLKSVYDPANEPHAVVEPGGRGYEDGSANVVTSIVVDYRMLDTFGEVLVLFATAAGVGLLMTERKRVIERDASVIITTATPVVMLFAIIVGAYIIVHGHLTPGGGFPGGAIIASGIILQYLAFRRNPRTTIYKVLESFAGLGILAIGLIGLFARGSLFAQFLPTGSLGALASAGTVMIIYSLIGIKVASELTAISGEFIGRTTRVGG